MLDLAITLASGERVTASRLRALTGASCWKVFTDHVTGTRERRPQLDRLLEQVRPGDTLVVWRLDRLGRSLRHLIDVATDLGGRGVGSGR